MKQPFTNLTKTDVEDFFGYREEAGDVLAAFSYDERRYTYRESYDYILAMLHEALGIRMIKEKPY